jgi:hypothetical protein
VGAPCLVIVHTSAGGLTEGWRSHNNGCGDVLSSWAPTTPGMVLQCSGWQYNGGDGRTGLELVEETNSTSPTSRRCPVRARGRCPYPFRGFRRPLSRGAACRPYWSGWHSVTEFTPAFPHSSPAVPGMAARRRGGGWRNSARIRFPGGVKGPAWRGFTFDLDARVVPEHLMLWSGERARGPRARAVLERGGDSPEGTSSPRARRRFARGGVRPSSEAEIRPRGRPALERGGDLVVRRLALE